MSGDIRLRYPVKPIDGRFVILAAPRGEPFPDRSYTTQDEAIRASLLKEAEELLLRLADIQGRAEQVPGLVDPSDPYAWRDRAFRNRRPG